MRGVYFDCSMGAAGDMLASSLYSLLSKPQREAFLSKMGSLFENIEAKAEKSVKNGITGERVSFLINGAEEGEESQGHKGIAQVRYAIEIDLIIDSLPLPQKVKEGALSVFRILYEAESSVHGEALDNIHLHEVGSLDAICDICAFCLLIDMLEIDNVLSSAINTGEGMVKAAHGLLPVPAPATAKILVGAKIYSDGIKSELCTPTGAALLKRFSSSFGPMPPISPIGIGYGMGKKDFERANCVRAFLYEQEASYTEDISEISANIDDMAPEDLAFACETLLNEGALDAFITPIVMKKGRAAFMVTCLCWPNETDRFTKLLFKHTSTIGARFSIKPRYALKRSDAILDTEYGAVHAKISDAFGVARIKVEFEDLKKLALEHGVSISEVRNKIKL